MGLCIATYCKMVLYIAYAINRLQNNETCLVLGVIWWVFDHEKGSTWCKIYSIECWKNFELNNGRAV